MGKKKQPANQFAIDFTLQARTILHLGQLSAQQAGEQLFVQLLRGDWLLEPAGELADISSAHGITNQLKRNLSYPQTIKIAQLHHVKEDFVGFSALYHDKGWIFLNALSDEYERQYYSYLLVASLGLYMAYSKGEVLAQRAEQLVFDSLLPENEVYSFFYKGINKISSNLAFDIADFFHVPFWVVLKRALLLGIITDEQYRNFMTIKPERVVKTRPLFVSRSGNLEENFDTENWIEDIS